MRLSAGASVPSSVSVRTMSAMACRICGLWPSYNSASVAPSGREHPSSTRSRARSRSDVADDEAARARHTSQVPQSDAGVSPKYSSICRTRQRLSSNTKARMAAVRAAMISRRAS